MSWFNSDNPENEIHKIKSTLYELILKEKLLKSKISKYEIDIQNYNTNITSLMSSDPDKANDLLVSSLHKKIKKLVIVIEIYEKEIENINTKRIQLKGELNRLLETTDPTNYMNNICFTPM